MHRSIKRIAITGGAGQISYNLLFRIASGEMFGKDQPVALHILELPEALKSLEGVKMELQDCAYPLLQEIRIGSQPTELFQDIDFALLVGARPRGPGMERGDLLSENGKIFVEQGKALEKSAKPDAKVLVIGNPCNTNCLITMTHAPKIPRKNFHALTRLDQNRAAAQLSLKANVPVDQVTCMTIWGNHSSTQVPDFSHAKISGKPVLEVIQDRSWLENEFISTVQKRGAEIIAARGKSSAASAASAIIDAIKALINPTPSNQSFSSGICSDENPYGINEGLIFSFPCQNGQDGGYKVVGNLEWDNFLLSKIKLTEKELIEERDLIKEMLKEGR